MGNGPDINYTLDLGCVDLKGQSKGNCPRQEESQLLGDSLLPSMYWSAN